ncbi:hypothetical protein Q428_11145 [Fervidicella metallireducens AeB]|uniref:DUF3592 domain-containing protein n=1 Tax=Fervidicella metallireducens AeB TaxID=1403537 RepID=A0A017RT62_9CLOT|nr:hypothetical protein [Fervidicella metallireducens]EYE87862.1 hypothetical protein Q428_11145 [Fervidicella metallireducens AeB]
MKRFLAFILGLICIILGLRDVVLPVIGEETKGYVVDIQRDFKNSDILENNYKVSYCFTTTDGKNVFGTQRIGNIKDVNKLPSIKSSHKVYYLKIFPYINVLQKNTLDILYSIFIATFGIILIITTLKKQ